VANCAIIFLAKYLFNLIFVIPDMAVKKYIASLLRRLNLGRLADTCRYRWLYCKRYRANRAFARQHPDFAFPPSYYIYETYTLDYRAYFEDGRQTAKEIMALLQQHINLNGVGKTIVDWGCGPGRVVRHLPVAAAGHRIVGCDYNDVYVQWCSNNIKEVTFLKNELLPPLPLPAASADAVYGLSIFTHLSATAHDAWAKELYRVLKPGGVLLLTVQGDTSSHKLLAGELAQYQKGQLIVRGFEKEGHRLFAAFQPPAFMRQLFSNFVVLRHITGGEPEGLDNVQDTWLLQKPVT
jgi:SAM-dependent methyltransferase